MHSRHGSGRRAHRCAFSMTLATVLFVSLPHARADISQVPLSVTQAVQPLVMFVMSNDHQLYYKAYTDWNDLDGDGRPETTYKHSFDYYGYFDSYKCYEYDTGDSRFEPRAGTEDKYCDAVSGDWSGNFLNWASMARMDILRKVLYGGYRSTDTSSTTVLERAFLPTDAHSFAKYYAGSDIGRLTPFTTVTSLTLCNATYYSGSTDSQGVTAPPLIRVAKGDFRYWAANERWQCTWDNERGDNDSGSNSTSSNTTDPNKTSDGLGSGDYNARVQVCVSGLIGTESCKHYPSGSYKPTGLLHDYGEDDVLKFGLMTGSYQKNKSGGVLRRNVGSFSTEVNVTTDGTFTGSAGIVSTLNKLRIARYHYGTGSGDGLYNTTDICPWGVSSFTEGNCSNWGNPLSELYLEAVRYFAGLSATSAFNANDTSYISDLSTATWSDPFSSQTWCARCNIILINASEVSYDNDAVSMSGLPGSPAASGLTNTVGDLEGISGHAYFVGENGTDNNQLCTAKTVNHLGDVRGTCPGSPRLSGTYYLDGIAHWAHTEDLRSDLQDRQSIATRAITLVPGVPKIVVPVPGSTGTVSILPACRNKEPNPDGNCAIVDFKIIAQDLEAGTGTFYVNWEDSEQGGDYDQDMKGTLRYSINTAAGTITITTDVDAKSTPHELGFGYVISGTTRDGFHVHSGINGFDYTDPGGVTGCSDCQDTNAATNYTYTLGSSTAGLLEDPLWYAAKYGSFRDLNDNDRPDRNDAVVGNQEWDADNDGVPDGYYLVTNPAALGPALAKVLTAVAGVSSSASVVANSVALQTGTYIYQGRFDSGDWSGDLLAFPLNLNGTVAQPAWQARGVLNGQNYDSGRVILTFHPGDNINSGVAFRWANLSTAQKDALRTPPGGGTLNEESVGQIRLDYLRGANTAEQRNGGAFRDREYVLGDVVNSEPNYIGAPPFFYPSTLEAASYDSFITARANRMPIIYVGANDGMLHGFSATDGRERIAYVPRAVYGNLSVLTSPTYGVEDGYSHRFSVDGNPRVGDAYLTGLGWRTVLVAGLRGGGKGMFGLDVTDPTQFAETNADSLVLWDITSEDAGFSDLGYTYSMPAIVKLPSTNNSGRWVAMFGNGYQSDTGHAVFYVVDLRTGDLLDSVVLDAGPGNGLSSVSPVDADGDHIVDFVYAGDLKGHIWRLQPDNADGWESAYRSGNSSAPLFSATDAAGNVLPITTRPEVGSHPNGGYMVYFGTGKYYEVGDDSPDATRTQAFYGVWDDGKSGITRAHLQEQTVSTVVTQSGYDLRLTSDNPVTWYTGNGLPNANASEKVGWRLNLPVAGEMQVTDSILHAGRIIFTTLIPSEQACDFGGTGWLMELDAVTGRRPLEAIFDLNGDGLFNNTDMVTITVGNQDVQIIPTGKKSEVGIIQKPIILAAGTMEYKYASGSNQAQIEVTGENPGEGGGGRQSWIQLQ